MKLTPIAHSLELRREGGRDEKEFQQAFLLVFFLSVEKDLFDGFSENTGEAEGQLDGRVITSLFQRDDGLSGDKHFSGKLLLCPVFFAPKLSDSIVHSTSRTSKVNFTNRIEAVQDHVKQILKEKGEKGERPPLIIEKDLYYGHGRGPRAVCVR